MDVGVHLVIGVVLRAVSGCCVRRRHRLTPQQVLTAGDWFQVVRADALADPTEMIELQAVRNWTDE